MNILGRTSFSLGLQIRNTCNSFSFFFPVQHKETIDNMARTRCYDKSGLKKGTWTTEEDRKLAAYVTRYGCWNWRQLPKFAGLARCGKSCRLRWLNYLQPNIKRRNYTKEEDEIIMMLHAEIGNKWSAIAAHLPGRSDNEIKNHWHTSLKKRSTQEESTSSTDSKKRSSINSKYISSSRKKRRGCGNQNSAKSNVPQLSPKQSCSEVSSCASIYVESMHVDSEGYQEEYLFEESSGISFWTEPFLVDNFSTNDFFVPSELDHGLVSPFSPVMSFDEFICSSD